MNIFILDPGPRQAAADLHDPHVVKMVLESAQLLSTAQTLLSPNPPSGLYKPTHENHPCAKWTRESPGNYSWLFSHLEGLLTAYTLRFKKTHKVESSGLFDKLSRIPEGDFPSSSLTPFAQAMPEGFKNPSDPIAAYRTYYRTTKAFTKSGKFMARYSPPATPPKWWNDYNETFYPYLKGAKKEK